MSYLNTERINISLTPEFKKELLMVSVDKSVTLSELIRQCCDYALSAWDKEVTEPKDTAGTVSYEAMTDEEYQLKLESFRKEKGTL